MLSSIQKGLPAAYYHDAAHYQRELQAVWYRDWIYVARATELPEAGSYLVAPVGERRVVLLRDEHGELQAFLNTCRHRGAELCKEPQGRLRGRRIVCPYHLWSYSLQGELISTPRRIPSDDFRTADFPLHRVAVTEWEGFVFVCLANEPEDFAAWHASETDLVAAWPLANLKIAHRETHVVACNWKIFWENYNECYHCPHLHPELCRIVPVYRKAVMNRSELADATPDEPPRCGPLASGAVTWSRDGRTELPWFAELGAAEREAGMTFTTLIPSLFVVAHVDYVRSVKVRPLGPQSTELCVDWLVGADTMEHPAFDIERLTELGRLVVMQDAEICETNQRGLANQAHGSGVLMPQEYELASFHDWLRGKLVVRAP